MRLINVQTWLPHDMLSVFEFDEDLQIVFTFPLTARLCFVITDLEHAMLRITRPSVILHKHEYFIILTVFLCWPWHLHAFINWNFFWRKELRFTGQLLLCF